MPILWICNQIRPKKHLWLILLGKNGNLEVFCDERSLMSMEINRRQEFCQEKGSPLEAH